MQNIGVCTGKQKNVVQAFCPTTVGISSGIGKLWLASVRCPTVICSPVVVVNVVEDQTSEAQV